MFDQPTSNALLDDFLILDTIGSCKSYADGPCCFFRYALFQICRSLSNLSSTQEVAKYLVVAWCSHNDAREFQLFLHVLNAGGQILETILLQIGTNGGIFAAEQVEE